MEDLTGRNLGQYRVMEHLGRGGMATVYRAYQPALDRYVAIKVLPAQLEGQKEYLDRFRQEARAVASFRHPNIVQVHDFGEDRGITYIVMEFVRGGTLKERLGAPMATALACHLAAQVARALDYAHRQGTIHRDVKPANILMASEDWALLSDFGIAKMVAPEQGYTKPGVGIGTPEYMSPEQGQGWAVDFRTDIYSLGVVLYEMLTGMAPFSADTPLAVIVQHMSNPLPQVRSVNPRVPEALERIVQKAMAKRAEERFQSASEMAEALESITRTSDDLTISADPPPPSSRSSMYLVIGGVVALVLLVGCAGSAGAFYLFSRSQSNSSTPTATTRAIAQAVSTPNPSPTGTAVPVRTPVVTSVPIPTTAAIATTAPTPTQLPARPTSTFPAVAPTTVRILSPTPPAVSGMKNFRSTIMPYSMGYPTNWTAKGNMDFGNGIRGDAFLSDSTGAFTANVNVINDTSVPIGMTSKAYLDANVTYLNNNMSIEADVLGSTVIDGNEAYLVTYSMVSGQTSYAVEQAIFVYGDLGWVITLSAAPAELGQYVPAFKQMLASLKFTD